MTADRPVKVLMVDDDEDDFLIVRDLLRDAGDGRYELTWVSQFDQGVRGACHPGTADVVLVDYRLGSHDGIRFVREVVARGCNAPVILLTGQGDRAVDLAAMEAGAADFLNKSQMTADLLERAIRYAVAQKKSEEQRLTLLAERAARTELEEAGRAKDEFLAMLSHELRTPLTPVLMTVSMLEKDPNLPPRVREDVSVIRRNLEIQVKLVDDLLDLTRVARGKFELREELADVHDLVQHALETTRRADPKSTKLDITVNLGAKKHYVWGDKARLEQVLWNLLRNAFKFTPEGGQVSVATRNPPEGGVAVTVSDSGVGIEPEKLPLIFNAFEQGGRGVTKQFGGLGLGLAICKGIVELHGGTIRVESGGPGQGATFTVTLPTTTVRQKPEPLAKERAAATPHGAAIDPRLRVLLVEDNLVTLKVMSRLFRDFGYEVTPAPDVATARSAAQKTRFDLVVSDLGLPDGDGLELMRQLRDQYGLRGIALSGYGQAQDVRESREAGFVEHLVKPVDFARLEAAVRRVTSGAGE
ncbi:MAG TPA: response regulator [Tepidisphaeraceae bacterium]|jgi:signal transduction histidine kinase